jgi:hypothetical protein
LNLPSWLICETGAKIDLTLVFSLYSPERLRIWNLYRYNFGGTFKQSDFFPMGTSGSAFGCARDANTTRILTGLSAAINFKETVSLYPWFLLSMDLQVLSSIYTPPSDRSNADNSPGCHLLQIYTTFTG